MKAYAHMFAESPRDGEKCEFHMPCQHDWLAIPLSDVKDCRKCGEVFKESQQSPVRPERSSVDPKDNEG